jgi:hypothetical protein
MEEAVTEKGKLTRIRLWNKKQSFTRKFEMDLGRCVPRYDKNQCTVERGNSSFLIA